MSKRLWVLDVDGTLMNNIHDYSRPILESAQVMVDALGDHAPDVVTIITLQDQIDKGFIKQTNPDTDRPYIFNMDRFPRSRVATYEELCRRAQVEPDQKVSERLLAIGYQAFDESRYQANVYPDAPVLTAFLRMLGDSIVLLTRGDPRVQERKLHALRQRDVIFDDAIIVEHDKAEDFARIPESFLDMVPVSVGDSYDSDIRPALALGYHAFWKPVYNWEQRDKIEQLRVEGKAAGVIEIRSLADIIARYKEMI